MGNRAGVLAAVVWCCLGGTTARADETALDSRETRLVELARTFPVIDTAAGDCPDFDLRCRGSLPDGQIQLDVRFRKARQLEVVGTHVQDESPLATWSNRRLIAFDPAGPALLDVRNVDLQLQFRGTNNKFLESKIDFEFTERRPFVRIDLPSMLLTKSGTLVDKGSTEKVRQMTAFDSTSKQQLTITFDQRKSRRISVSFDDEKAAFANVSVEIQLDPNVEESLVENPTAEDLNRIAKVESYNVDTSTPGQLLDICGFVKRATESHFEMLATRKKNSDTSTPDIAVLKANRAVCGRMLSPLLIHRATVPEAERERLDKIAKIAERLPELDTRKPDCPPFLFRSRFDLERGAVELTVRHHGQNAIESTLVTVPEGHLLGACVEGNGLFFDPVNSQVLLTRSTKLQIGLSANENRTIKQHFAVNWTGDFEQYVVLDVKAIALKGATEFEDCGSLPDFFRLRLKSSRNNSTEIEFFPRLDQPVCQITAPGLGEFYLQIGAGGASSLTKIAAEEAIREFADVVAVSDRPALKEAAEGLFWLIRSLFANLSCLGDEPREIYSSIDNKAPDWMTVRENQIRIGGQLRDLMSISKPSPLQGDQPHVPLMAADEITPPR